MEVFHHFIAMFYRCFKIVITRPFRLLHGIFAILHIFIKGHTGFSMQPVFPPHIMHFFFIHDFVDFFYKFAKPTCLKHLFQQHHGIAVSFIQTIPEPDVTYLNNFETTEKKPFASFFVAISTKISGKRSMSMWPTSSSDIPVMLPSHFSSVFSHFP